MPRRPPARAASGLAALGVVFGDIGTSPIYAFRECFGADPSVRPSPENVLGVLSLIAWALLLIVSLKYLAYVMRADNRGEGGILALHALIGATPGKRRPRLAAATGLAGAALLYGDGMITPAISVLSAVEGVSVSAPALEPLVQPLAVVLLLALFAFQSRGTERVGAVFGPVMVVWFAVIGCLGLATIAAQPGVLRALSPHHGLAFLVREGWASAAILGAVFLVVTGAEALYADMGQFGRPVIRRLWLFAVLPALLLCYFGQGALVLARPEEAAQPFFHLAPAWARLPLVALTTGATIIASQAVISGAFSLTSQAIQLGELPRLRVLHTSMRAEGQVYLPAVNWILCAATIGLVLGFGSSSRLAGAYGVAVSATMLATTLLAFRVSIERWRWSVAIAAAVSLGFLLVDGAFLGANLLKIRAGGWFPLVVAACLLVLMTTWRRGRELLARGLRADTEPLHLFLQRIAADPPQRIPGTAVFLTRPRASTPPILLRYLERFGVLHENVVVASVSIDATPTVRDEDRAHVVRLSEDLCVVRLHFGFMEHPDVPAALRACAAAGIGEHEPTYFVGRESAVPSRRPGMAAWREALFAFLERNASDVTSYFRLPTEDVIELGIRVEI